jgi:hypothetical protein
MISTGEVDSPYREVERADTGQNSYKATHDWSDFIGRCSRWRLIEHRSRFASSSPTAFMLRMVTGYVALSERIFR